MTPGTAPGWYPDPRGGDGQRYWTGESWAQDQASAAWQPTDWAPSSSSATTYLSSHQTGFEPGPSAWRRAATWLALSGGIVAGFAAGFAVGDARDRGSTQRAAVASPASTPPPSFAPSRPPSVESGPPPDPTASDAPPEPADPDAPLLDGLGLRPGDVAPDVIVGLIPGGGQVTGQPTLDLCKAAYPSESRRTARRQLVAVDGAGAQVLSTEAVLYDSAAATESGFKELTGAAPKCSAKTGIDKGWAQVSGVQRLAFDDTIPDANGVGRRSTAVYLRHDRVLLALYFSYPGVTTTPVAGQKTIPAVVAVFARRLAGLPSTTVMT